MPGNQPTPAGQFHERTGAFTRRRVGDGLQMPTIRVVAGPDLLASYAVYPTERIIIGRDATCSVVLTDHSVSREHASIEEDDGELWLEDLGSTNGTAVDTQPVRVRTPLPMGTVFYVGNVALRVDLMSIEEIHHLERVAERLRQVVQDPLTGVLGRTWLEEELPGLVARHRHHGQPMSALFVDADHFKNINDSFGHGVGDHVLRSLAQMLSALLRDTDKVVRYGGEEFLCLLAGCDEDEAIAVAERLRCAIADHGWGLYQEGLQVTVSIGAASVEPGETPEAWLDRADQAMYAAKSGGRNQVVGARMGARTAA